MLPSSRRSRASWRAKLTLSLALGLLIAAPVGAQDTTSAPQAPSAPAQPAQTAEQMLERAELAWDRGEYQLALQGYMALLDMPGGAAHRRAVALTTGELYNTIELARDGRSLRVSPRGSYVAFESGTGSNRRAFVRGLPDGRPLVNQPGFGVTVSPDEQSAAFVRENGELMEIVVRGLRGRGEAAHSLPGLRVVGAPAFGSDSRTVYFLATQGRDTATTLYALREDARSVPVPILQSETIKADLVLLPGGRHLLFTEGRRTRTTRPAVTYVYDLRENRVVRLNGYAASASANGAWLTYLSRSGDTTSLHIHALTTGDDPRTLLATTDPIDNPALSPAGDRVAYQRMLRDDWEIFVIGADGEGHRRLTREIQHDLMPRFLDDDTILAVMGESRHRRSFLYDVETGRRTRLFHNNTVRTIAPEYDWAAVPDGSVIVILADRDGDTISPERGVYVTDLSQEVTLPELQTRLLAMWAGERDLRRNAEAMFAPIADVVRHAVAEVSTKRLYDYQKALVSFDSRHVTQPGSDAAAQWLHDTFAAMGYEPELQWFEPTGLPRTANVVATLPGTVTPGIIYVVGAHYDSRAEGPGADDNATGTAMLLELARVLRDRPLPATVMFVAFAAEESGLLGSREWARQARESGLHVAGALNNDMFGWSNDHRLDNTIRYSNAGIRDVQHAGALLFSRLITYDARYYQNTDAHALFDAFGDVIGGIGSYPVLGNPHYHQPHDILETINQEQVTETVKATLAAVMLLASTPSRVPEVTVSRSGTIADVWWQPAPEPGITGYRVSYRSTGGRTESLTVTDTRTRLVGVVPGSEVWVRPIGQHGVLGWGWGVGR